MDDATGVYEITLIVPHNVLLGAVQIVVGSGLVPDSYVDGAPASVANLGHFAYTASNSVRQVQPDGSVRAVGPGIDIIQTTNADQVNAGPEQVIKSVVLKANPLATVVSSDVSRVFIATTHGIDILDALTLSLFNPMGTGITFDANGNIATYDPSGHIDVGGDDLITALTLDNTGSVLYAAGTGVVYVIDVGYGDKTFGQVIARMKINAKSDSGGYISTIALNADSTRLFVGTPGSRLFAGTNDVINGGRDGSTITIFDVDPADFGDKVNGKYFDGGPNGTTYLGSQLLVGLDIWTIAPTSDRLRMVFTTRGSLDTGFNTLTILQNTNQKFLAADETKPLSLKINAQTIGIKKYNDTFGGLTGLPLTEQYRIAGSQYYDLNNHDSTGVAVTGDLQFAFVADYGLTAAFTNDENNDAVVAYNIDVLHDTGSKITVIQDPFGRDGAPKVLGSTTPIPTAFFTDLVIDAAGAKLYALAPGTNTIIVYDLKKLEAQAQNPVNQLNISINPHVVPLDPDLQGFGGTTFGYTLTDPGISIDGGGRGLSVDDTATLVLNGPTSHLDLNSDHPEPLVFDWTINEQLLGSTNDNPADTGWLYVSAEIPGQGLWPNDPGRTRRAITNAGDKADLPPNADGDPGRIFTQKPFIDAAGDLIEGFQPGHAYEVFADGSIKEIKDGSLAPGETRVTFDPVFAHILTAGQNYYWGVEVNGTADRQSATFETKAIKPANASYGIVTLLTDGFELTAANISPTSALAGGGGNTPLKTPQQYIALAQLIVKAEGGGSILEYNKATGQWDNALDPTDTRTGAALLQAGLAVVLISDWTFESTITDSGFAEAAADAIFAALVDLDRQTGYSLLGTSATGTGGNASPIQFIGYNRGATVNSEIVQRFDQYFPGIKDITVTSLNPSATAPYSPNSPASQATLNIPLQQILQGVEAVNQLVQLAAGLGAVTALVAGGITTIVTKNPEFIELGAEVAEDLATLIENLQTLNNAIENLLMVFSLFDVGINPIGFGTGFSDKPVVRWSNEQFADTYYQTGALQSFPTPSATAGGTLATIGLPAVGGKPGDTFTIPVIPTYTFTANGSPGDPSKQNIDANLNQLAGFGHDDFPRGLAGLLSGLPGSSSGVLGLAASTASTTPFGFGAVSQEVLDWYAGTVNPTKQTFYAAPIFRRASDQGLRVTIDGVGLGLGSDKSEEFSSVGWYAVDPLSVAGNGSYTTLGAVPDPNQPQAAFNGPTVKNIQPNGTTLANLKQEGVGTGFFYGPGGGGQAYDPMANSITGINSASLVMFNPDGSVVNPELQPLDTVFNGSFDYGDNQSFLSYLTSAGNPVYSKIYELASGGKSLSAIPGPAGRFPVSYSLPGWSFQGGSGFTIGLQGVTVPGVGNPVVDITGLFVTQLDPKTLGNFILKGLEQTFTTAFSDAFSNETNLKIAAAQAGGDAGMPVDPMATKFGQTGNAFLTVLQTVVQNAYNTFPAIQPQLQGLLDVVNQAQANYKSAANTDPGQYATASGKNALLNDFNNAFAALLNIGLPTAATAKPGTQTVLNNGSGLRPAARRPDRDRDARPRRSDNHRRDTWGQHAAAVHRHDRQQPPGRQQFCAVQHAHP